MRRLLLAWSGGKDSAWTLHTLRQAGEFEVTGLLTTFTEGLDRASTQGIRRDALHAQARAAGLPLLESWQPPRLDNATYEARFAAALDAAAKRWPGIADIAFGDLLLTDVRDWRVALCQRLGWRAHFPLFDMDTAKLARTMITGGLRARLCCVDTARLDAGFVGRQFDAALLDALPPSIDPCGERGEFHTCVLAGPMFSAPLALMPGDILPGEGNFLYRDFLLPGQNDAGDSAIDG
ncbi:ATP-binding protein [Lysobacter pythonis]|uniref:ATP-binding protein n=1 Tax=Solilutibacter pythonis TaxID=2483112 RepID=A0A3M2HZZ7_9GAMM|nr:ATP-binding protein [Lysobacter pythonis]RMH93220.1 ATP-binding protein [Lysobacter pythonis]